MDKKYVVGIDSGTQSTRVIIFDTRGQKVCMGTAAHPPLIAEKAPFLSERITASLAGPSAGWICGGVRTPVICRRPLKRWTPGVIILEIIQE